MLEQRENTHLGNVPTGAIIVGALEPYTEPVPAGWEVWGLNMAYRHQPNLDRLYLTDDLRAFPPEVPQEVNAANIPLVVTRKECPAINNVRVYTDEMFHDAFELFFVASVAAYAISDVIREGYSEVVLHRMYIKGLSEDYRHHTQRVGYWAGQAMASGVRVVMDPDNFVCSPESLEFLHEAVIQRGVTPRYKRG